MSVTPAEGPPLGATSGPDGRFALVLPLEEGRNPFRVRVGDGREVELVVRRLRPIEAREFKESYLVERTLAGRVELIRRLDPTRAPQRDLALDFALAKLDADQREAAIEAIASVPFDELEWVEKLAGERGDPPVAEGLVEALGRAGDPRAVPLIAGQLEARKTIVADAAIRALGRIGTAECVAHLTSASLAEVASRNGPRSLRTLHETLRELGQPAPPPADEESLEAFSGGVRLAVRVRGRPDAKGLPIYVFPPPGLSADVMVPYLEPLEADSRLIYVELPGRRALPRDAEVRAGRFYPLERVLEAVEELHVALVETRRISGHRVAMVGCGLSGWIPMLYAAKHPKAARRQVLIGVPSGAKAWREGLASMEAKGKEIGDLEMERVFRAAEVDPLFLERSPDAARKAISLLFADVRDLEIVRLRGPLQEGDRWWIQRPIGELEVPDFSLFRLDRSSTPTLVMVGGMSTRCSLEDAGAIARHYQPAGKVVVYKLCDQVPWIERQEEFLQDLRRFLGVGPR